MEEEKGTKTQGMQGGKLKNPTKRKVRLSKLQADALKVLLDNIHTAV